MNLSKKQFWINFFSASIGNLFEHYDKALFAFLAPFLAPLFFKSSSNLTNLILTYAMIPLGVFSKPLGALFFGKMGDERGRRHALYFTLIGMALTTILMGCLPTFSQVGWIAPLLLAVGRLSQSFFASGEKTGGALLILEACDEKKRSFYNGLYDCSTIFGILLASLGVTWLSLKGTTHLHWRLLYWIGGITGFVGLLMRLFTKEVSLKPQPKRPIVPFLWENRRPLLLVIFTSGLSYANYYMVTALLNGFLPLVSAINPLEAMQANSLILCLDFLLLPLGGLLTLRVSKEKLLVFFASAICLLAIPLYLLLPTATLFIAILVRLIFVTLGVGFSVILTPYYQDIIPIENRYTLISFGSAIGSQFFGATACSIGFFLFKQTGWAGAPAIYLMLTSVLAIGALQLAPRLLPIKRML